MGYAWATAICAAIPRPPYPGNIRGLAAWQACEKPAGNLGQWNNPLNTKEPGYGGTNALSNGVKRYPTPAQGVAATAATLRNGNYPNILGAMRKPAGLSAGIRNDPGVQRDIGTWGTDVRCIASRLGGSLPANYTNASGGLTTSGLVPNPVKGVSEVGSFLGALPRYLEIAGGGVVLVFGILVAIVGGTGAGRTALRTGKTVAKIAAVAG